MLLSAALVIAFLSAVALPCTALAGVHFDPESPAGTEYALPLPTARNEAVGGGGGGTAAEGGTRESQSTGEAGGAAAAPLYGAGVEPAGTGRGSEGEEGHGGRATATQGSQPGSGGSQSAEPAPRASPRLIARAEGSSYPLGRGIAIAAGIVLGALAVGLALRAYGSNRASRA